MGKGSRNRSLHQQDRVENPQKKKRVRKQTPAWVMPLVLILLVGAILTVALSSVISGTGMIERNRILIESESGEYDLSQSMATFMAWQTMYQYSYYMWSSIKTETVTGTAQTYEKYYGTAANFALSNASAVVQNDLRGSIDSYLDIYKEYVAVCDAAHAANVTLDQEDLDTIDSTVNELKEMQEEAGYTSFNSFLSVTICEGMKEKDIRSALTMTILHDKYRTQVEEGFEASVTLADLLAFREENPDKYYKTDYLLFASPTKELAEKLTAAKDEREFKEIIVQDHFDNNYAQTYFTFLSDLEYAQVSGKTNSNGGTALTDALDKIGVPAEKTYSKTDFTDADKTLTEWLFSSARTAGQTTKIATSKGIYLASFVSADAANATVNARIKFYDYATAGDAHEDDEDFKAMVLKVLMAEKHSELLHGKLSATDADVESILKANNAVELKGITKTSEDVPEALLTQVFDLGNKAGTVNVGFGDGIYYVVYIRTLESVTEDGKTVKKADVAYCAFGESVAPYLSGSEKSDALLDQLKADGADMEKIMRENDPIEKKDITKSTPKTEVPAAIINVVFKTGAAAKNVYTANANGVYYVIYVTAHDTEKASILYVECESDFFYKVANSLIAALDDDGAYPSTKKIGYYKPDAAANTFEAWMSEVKAGTLESLRKEYDVKMFEGKDKEDKTVYNVYMILNTPMYLDTYTVVDGAYLQVSDDDDKGHLTKTLEFMDKLNAAIAEGKTGEELTTLLYSLSANTKIQSNFSKGAIPSSDLKEWFFDESRQANEVNFFKGVASSYIGIYVGRSAAWEAAAKTDYVTDKTSDWVDSLTAKYTVNEKVLNRIGTTEATTVATTAATTAKKES